MDNLYPALLSALVGLAAAGAAWSILQLTRGITYVRLADGRLSERRLPILVRLLLPFTPNLAHFFDRTALEPARKKLRGRLVAAGLEEVMGPEDFMALRVLSMMVIIPVMYLLFWGLFPMVPWGIGDHLRANAWVFYLATVPLAYFYTGSWLKGELAKRQSRMRKALPFVVDLLTLSVEAGMDFMSAMQRIVDRRALDPLGEELIRLLREIQLGRTRKEALREMAQRTAHMDIRSVTNALIQADEMGVSIGSVLRIQADQMRTRRFHRAEKLAHEAPVKMLFPLVVFIFPAVLVILLGPILMEASKIFF
jgi:tight adherence protein C